MLLSNSYKLKLQQYDRHVSPPLSQAVLAFQKEAGVEPEVDMSSLDEQIRIRGCIEAGRISEAVELINEADPDILDTDARLFFHLQQQRLLELIRRGDEEEVLRFAQSELAPLGEENHDFLDELEQTLALLAFEDPASSPFSGLLQHSQRLKVVSEVNGALLSSRSQEPGSRLSTLLKMALWAQEQLEKKGVAFPKLESIVSGRLQKTS